MFNNYYDKLNNLNPSKYENYYHNGYSCRSKQINYLLIPKKMFKCLPVAVECARHGPLRK